MIIRVTDNDHWQPKYLNKILHLVDEPHDIWEIEEELGRSLYECKTGAHPFSIYYTDDNGEKQYIKHLIHHGDGERYNILFVINENDKLNKRMFGETCIFTNKLGRDIFWTLGNFFLIDMTVEDYVLK
jgi:hypothetical protein